jgi:hypothetical protein
MAEQESVYLWSTTALTNGSSDPAVNFAEGQLPGTVNNSNRAGMAAIARFVKDTDGSLTTAGSANAYTLTINGRMTPLATGHFLTFKASFSNTGAATIAVTNADAVALGTKAIRGPGDVALTSGQMISGGVYQCRYDTAANSAAGAWILLNPNAGTVTGPASSTVGHFAIFNNTGGTLLADAGATTPTVIVYTTPGANTWTKATYPGMTAVIVEVIGAGGGSGGTAATGGAESAIAAAGGGGGYSMKRIAVATLGATETVTIGAGGTAGASGNNAGGTGGTTSFGSHLSATGGGAGGGGGNAATGNPSGTAGGIGSSGDLNLKGEPSAPGAWNTSIALLLGTTGGSAARGGGGGSAGAANAGGNYGGGASGPVSFTSAAAKVGAAGADGVCIVTVLYT